jgi:hypothetical protein
MGFVADMIVGGEADLNESAGENMPRELLCGVDDPDATRSASNPLSLLVGSLRKLPSHTVPDHILAFRQAKK